MGPSIISQPRRVITSAAGLAPRLGGALLPPLAIVAMKNLWRSPMLWIGIPVSAAAWAMAWGLRETIIDPSAAALACSSAEPPPWCPLRTAILVGQLDQLWGLAALAVGIFALLRGPRWAAVLAPALGLVAIVNYNVEMGVLALIFGLLAAIKGPPRPVPRGDATQA
jgi:hypothetical protein